MDIPLPERQLVGAVEAIADDLRDRSRESYDGVTESGAGPLFVALPGRSMDVFADYVEEMHPLPWADAPQNVYLVEDDNGHEVDEGLVSILHAVDRYTDGAILVNGAGRLSNYTYELEPTAKLTDQYPEHSGTKLRATVNITDVDLPGGYMNDIEYVRELEGVGTPDTAVPRDIYVPRRGPYGDVVAVTVSSATGRRFTADDGEIVAMTEPIQPRRDVSTLWDQLRREALEDSEPDAPFDRFDHPENGTEATAELGDIAEIDGDVTALREGQTTD